MRVCIHMSHTHTNRHTHFTDRERERRHCMYVQPLCMCMHDAPKNQIGVCQNRSSCLLATEPAAHPKHLIVNPDRQLVQYDCCPLQVREVIAPDQFAYKGPAHRRDIDDCDDKSHDCCFKFVDTTAAIFLAHRRGLGEHNHDAHKERQELGNQGEALQTIEAGGAERPVGHVDHEEDERDLEKQNIK
jgi:hypothetical protein